jgi:hypothetical protein
MVNGVTGRIDPSPLMTIFRNGFTRDKYVYGYYWDYDPITKISINPSDNSTKIAGYFGNSDTIYSDALNHTVEGGGLQENIVYANYGFNADADAEITKWENRIPHIIDNP